MSMNGNAPRCNHAWIDHIPAIWIDRVQSSPRRELVIWLPWFTGDKEAMMPYLTDLSQQGYVALSYDPWEHGERAKESTEALHTRVFGNYRRHMWPILAHTAVEVLRVVDWAIESLDVEPSVYLGGISMGGCIAVAAAGIETRVISVAAHNATPDWTLLAMDTEAGTADAYSRYLLRCFNPLFHLDAYAHCPAIAFECGAEDRHVPPDGALRFQAALRETYGLCPDKLQVNVHAGAGHQSTAEMWQNSLAWFARAKGQPTSACG
jgi:dienelactone hydrolase